MRWDKAVSVLGIGLLAVNNNQHDKEAVRQGSLILLKRICIKNGVFIVITDRKGKLDQKFHKCL